MEWKKGRIEFDDGTVYPAEFLMKGNGIVWNVKVYKDGKIIKEIDADEFSNKLGKSVEDVYPYKYHIE
ncbi:hypothetical protein SAMN05661008_01228 [Alkalithermobacter thermoalcaliphilus JW-YL-7 = DSM 7308]|uniref:Uncharacterized protein n=1 Tax=Alkalithermobacter thermoalcaliphilus JW-YL-7 = DSM 7308 TaxID=1121328 RepID=A0A150FPN5_CLOPD|nr:hypothetical protein JWYL7_0656 [[Clostridium] paradoxum JW-YL-7 = DSM 7308]SHK97153.1 hypothetical protein SAMN05661008_01228 [[Clostridium] paradoxum JW-YL-7 = DSM 7308]